MPKKKIISFFGDDSEVFHSLNQRAVDYAAVKGMDYEWSLQNPFRQESVIEGLRRADAGIIDVEPYDENIFSQIGSRLGILVRFGVGYDKVDLDAASAHHIAVARTTGANTTAVAEMALMLMLAVKRKLMANVACLQENRWEKTVSHELIGSAVGIVGFGSIGRRLAELLRGFGCELMAYDPYPDEKAMRELGVELVGLEELFQRADAISLHTAYTEQSAKMVNHHLLSLMKPSAILVNTSRGGVIDEDALCDALASHSIGGAGLDVFVQEPLAEDSPLRKMDNVVLTPHISSQTEEALWNIYKMAIDIITDFFEGRQSPHILNKI